MRVISNTFLAQIRTISEQQANVENAMKRNMIQTKKLLHAEYAQDLFNKLRKIRIGNAKTEELSEIELILALF